MSETFTVSDVESHNKPSDLYIIVDEDVYDLTQFQDEHPGMFVAAFLSAGLSVSTGY
jgi:cytochrome b involved in lipid metabolism